MKKYCKNVNITNRELISVSVYKCIDNKIKRNDTLELLSLESGLSKNQVYYIIHRYGKPYVYWIVELLIDTIQTEMKTKSINFIPIWYKEKKDTSSGKIRKIGIQNIKQQIYDYIAVEALTPLLVRIGRHQYASIKGRGQIKGTRRISRWLRNKSIRYFGKADIQKCYESIDKNRLMDFLRKHIKNDDLLWLIQKLIDTFKTGLSIGSYLSQYLCNLYLSQLYHEISHFHRIRKHKDGTREYVSLVKHVLFYMDDILIMGTNAKDIHKAIKLIEKYAKEKLGLSIKMDWFVSKTELCNKQDDKNFIDMMGFRVYRWHTTIRRRVFKRIRRAYIRALRKIKLHQKVPLSIARRCISYYGQIKNSNSHNFYVNYKVREIIKICKKVVSKNEKSPILRTAIAC